MWMEIPFEVALARAQQRDVGPFGSTVAVKERYRAWYIPGQRLYLELAHPREQADAIVDNADPAEPVLSFRKKR